MVYEFSISWMLFIFSVSWSVYSLCLRSITYSGRKKRKNTVTNWYLLNKSPFLSCPFRPDWLHQRPTLQQQLPKNNAADEISSFATTTTVLGMWKKRRSCDANANTKECHCNDSNPMTPATVLMHTAPTPFTTNARLLSEKPEVVRVLVWIMLQSNLCIHTIDYPFGSISFIV